jgi:hypothetical protein
VLQFFCIYWVILRFTCGRHSAEQNGCTEPIASVPNRTSGAPGR